MILALACLGGCGIAIGASEWALLIVMAIGTGLSIWSSFS